MWVYNLDSPDPDTQVPRVIAINVVFPVTALLAVAFRFIVRLRLKRTPWVDDYAALSSAVLVAVYAAIAIAQTRWGLGLHAEYFPKENVVPFGKIQYAGGPIYCMALLGFKVAMLASYLRIGGFVESYKRIIQVVIVACVCNQIAFTLVLSLGCQPVAKQWDATLPGKCIQTVSSYYGLAGTSLGFDILIIALPLPVLMNLQLRRRQKIALVAIFALGFFVTIIQIIRIFTVKNLKTYTDSQPIVLWSTIEVSLGYRHTQSKSNTYALATRGGASSNTNKSRHTRRKTKDINPLTGDTNASSHFDTCDNGVEILDDGTTIHGKGGGHSTTIMSMAMKPGKGRRKADGDTDSEELIRDSLSGNEGQHNNGASGRYRAGTPLDSLPGTTTSLEDPFHIHTMTEVRVERHEI